MTKTNEQVEPCDQAVPGAQEDKARDRLQEEVDDSRSQSPSPSPSTSDRTPSSELTAQGFPDGSSIMPLADNQTPTAQTTDKAPADVPPQDTKGDINEEKKENSQDSPIDRLLRDAEKEGAPPNRGDKPVDTPQEGGPSDDKPSVHGSSDKSASGKVEQPSEKKEPKTDVESDKLSGQLGDDNFATRESARKQLIDGGAKSMPSVMKALGSSDAEVKRQAQEAASEKAGGYLPTLKANAARRTGRK